MKRLVSKITSSGYEAVNLGDTDNQMRYGQMLNEMLTTRQTPCLSTDNSFMQGRRTDNSFAGLPIKEAMGDHYKKIANRAGVSVKGKTYIGGLARFAGDPEAWVDSKGDAKRIIEKRGWSSEGSVTVAPRDDFEPFDDKKYMVADRLVDAATNERLEQIGEPLKEQERLDLKEKVREEITPRM